MSLSGGLGHGNSLSVLFQVPLAFERLWSVQTFQTETAERCRRSRLYTYLQRHVAENALMKRNRVNSLTSNPPTGKVLVASTTISARDHPKPTKATIKIVNVAITNT